MLAIASVQRLAVLAVASVLQPLDDDPTVDDASPACYLSDVNGSTCLPGFLVLGLQKCGTSSLYAYLNAHPQLTLKLTKELLHWGTNSNAGEFNCSAPYLNTYLDLFEQVAPGRMTGDFTATDAACVCCAAAAHELLPDARLIVLMRDPIERAVSRYREQFTFVQAGAEKVGCDANCLQGSLRTYLRVNLPVLAACLRDASTVLARAACAESDQVLGWSLYGAMTDNWLAYYPLEQMLLVRSQALADKTLGTLRVIERFLGLAPANYSQSLLSQRFNTNASYGWSSGSDGSEIAHVEASSSHSLMATGLVRASGVGTSCGAACLAAAELSDDERSCLAAFYDWARGTRSPADRFYADPMAEDTCSGHACVRSPTLVAPTVTFDAIACLGNVTAMANRRDQRGR